MQQIAYNEGYSRSFRVCTYPAKHGMENWMNCSENLEYHENQQWPPALSQGRGGVTLIWY